MDQLSRNSNKKTLLAVLAPERRLLALILITLGLRYVFAAATGLGVDEAYTVATARPLALSAFDHPPMTWWVVHFAGVLFGESDLALRAPFILLFALTTWLMFALTRRLFGAEAGFWAAFALNLSPALGLTDGSWILPDAPLLPALLGCALALAQVFFHGDMFFDGDRAKAAPYWLLAGLCAGLAMLSKYHGVLVFPGVLLFLLFSPRQRFWLATPWPWLAGLIALACFAPVLVWNAQHDWVSLLFQGGRSGAPRLNLVAPLALIGLQCLYLAPWLFFPLAALFFRALARGAAEEKGFFLACLAATPIILFTLVAFWSSKRVLPHWVAPGYLLIFPLLGREIAERLARGAPNLQHGLAAAAVFVVIGVGLIYALPRVTPAALAGTRYPLFELLDWDQAAQQLASRGLLREKTFVAATRWLDAGKLDYALRGAAPVLCLSDDPRGFGLLRDAQAFVGQDAVLLAPKMSPDDARAHYGKYFDSLEPLSPITIDQGGAPAITLDAYLAKSFHDPAPEFSLRRQVKDPARP